MKSAPRLQNVGLKLTPRQLEYASRVAASQQISISEWVRRLLDTRINADDGLDHTGGVMTSPAWTPSDIPRAEQAA